ncbi:MAG TPA: nucleotide exchange factor GrpE [Methylotenera sp.]|nr:nucleotide exchange factor GrpE [Methylotenera sp.]
MHHKKPDPEAAQNIETDMPASPEVQTAQDQMQENGAAGSLDARIGELESQLAEAQAAVLYIKAEGENIRRRATEDIDKARKFALEKFSNELLAVKDSLDAALLIEATDVQSYKDGVELTAKQLVSVFDKFNIAEINPAGEKFDPNKHQAISMLESDQEPNTVINVLQKGYTLNERVLRPALVMVAKAK